MTIIEQLHEVVKAAEAIQQSSEPGDLLEDGVLSFALRELSADWEQQLRAVEGESDRRRKNAIRYAVECGQARLALEEAESRVAVLALRATRADALREALRIAEAGLMDIGSGSERHIGDDIDWAEKRADEAIVKIRALTPKAEA